jgi:hypothetical protein
LDHSPHRRRTLRLGATVLAISGLAVAPALVGQAADPPFDAFVSDACASFGQGPSGEVAIQPQVSVTGTGPIRTVQARISWQGGDPADSAANLCIGRGDTLFASVTATSLTANELTATFTVGLGLSGPDLAIDNGDRVCNVGVVFVGAEIGVSDTFCTDPIMLPPPDLGSEPLPSTGEPLPSTGGPLPSTGGPLSAGVLVGGVLALLVGAAALVLARRPT